MADKKTQRDESESQQPTRKVKPRQGFQKVKRVAAVTAQLAYSEITGQVPANLLLDVQRTEIIAPEATRAAQAWKGADALRELGGKVQENADQRGEPQKLARRITTEHIENADRHGPMPDSELLKTVRDMADAAEGIEERAHPKMAIGPEPKQGWPGRPQNSPKPKSPPYMSPDKRTGGATAEASKQRARKGASSRASGKGPGRTQGR